MSRIHRLADRALSRLLHSTEAEASIQVNDICFYQSCSAHGRPGSRRCCRACSSCPYSCGTCQPI